MNWAYLSVLAVGVMPVVCTAIAKAGAKHYDNHDVRTWLARQTGFRARANAAQSNCFEAFPFFAVGVVSALLSGVDHAKIDALSVTFVLVRIAYIGCYLADKATFRSIVWAIGYICIITLYALAIQTS
jgi:uncharacterized MAPEG superfamily protein